MSFASIPGLRSRSAARSPLIGALLLPTLALRLLAPATADARPKEVVKVAEGVYVFIHANATEDWPHSNTTVIIGKRDVLVVDSSYLPSTARDDLDEIKRLTDRPVRYLLNTHWHYDHNQGNQAYLERFPDLDIIAQAETRRLMDANAAGFASRVTAPGSSPNQELQKLRDRLAGGKPAAETPATKTSATKTPATGKPASGQPVPENHPADPPMSAEEQARLSQNIADRAFEQADLKTFRYTPPNVTFDHTLTLDLGGREVRLEHHGRGNTPGDAFVYLPADKVLITGDLVVAPVPYAFNSYPSPWIDTLHYLDGFDASTLVPGHGPVMHDKTYLHRVTTLLESCVQQVRVAAPQAHSLEKIRKIVDLEPFRKQLAGEDPLLNQWFQETVQTPLIERAWREAIGEQ